MMIALQMNQEWIAFAVLVISVLTSKELLTSVTFIIATVVLYFVVGTGNSESTWAIAIFGLIVVAILLGAKEQPAQSDMGGYGDMFGGMGGTGGY